jgi:hypothetical protein
MGKILDRTLDEIEERRVFVCDCHSLEHQFSIWYDEDLNQIYIEPHLYHSGNWFGKLWGGIKYIFGYKTRFGNWDETIIDTKDIPKLREYFDVVENEDKKRFQQHQAEIDAETDLIVDRGRD